MNSLKFNNGDLEFVSKRAVIVSDLDQKIQKTAGLLYIVLGEMFFDSTMGMDRELLLDIETKDTPMEKKKFAVTDALLQDNTVSKVDDIIIDYDRINRKTLINVRYKYKEYKDKIQLGGIKINE
ncbi:TPA: hypothetical protein LA747_003403 [Clostridium botulinum]|uniref:hypothetical protein n=1 Tax=Clostridium botulinum TaxID=1491 RepID=UPI000517EB91|nr:hypothetical protein [Clostridium botulinum]APC82157.1 hypothetical protein NPD12_3789 [Clostridium botulinum]HBJ1682475.1 hypothetical protein [Clostridium botulinum]HBJ1686082.1 hypothetical protein [Clostridium botulinum]HBJ2607742.1 hypothetical protein [Clostridium botulinum]HDI3019095.1 hypothetical protein [Clostridium botulinum]